MARRATGYDTRGGSPDRPSRHEVKKEDSATAVFGQEVGPLYDEFLGETKEEHGFPRQSLTARQGLAYKDEILEFEQLKPTRRLQAATLDPANPKKVTMVETTDPRFRLTFKSDRNLLRRGKVDNFGEGRGTRYARETARTKERIARVEYKEAPPTCADCGCGRHEHNEIAPGIYNRCNVVIEGKPCKCKGYQIARPDATMMDDM